MASSFGDFALEEAARCRMRDGAHDAHGCTRTHVHADGHTQGPGETETQTQQMRGERRVGLDSFRFLARKQPQECVLEYMVSLHHSKAMSFCVERTKVPNEQETDSYQL